MRRRSRASSKRPLEQKAETRKRHAAPTMRRHRSSDVDKAKKAEERLRRSEAYLAEAQRLSHTGSFGWTPATGDFHWSNETFRILEYDSSVKPTMERLVQRVYPDDLAIVRQAIDEASRGGKVDITHRLLMPDGSVKFVHVLGHALTDAAGNLEIVGAVMDVTERRRAEQALRRSEAWLAQAQTLNHTGTFVMDGITRRFLYWSDENYRIWGFDPLQGVPSREDMWGRVHPDDRERLWEIVQTALREQRDFFEEGRILLSDGTVRYLEINSYHEFSPLAELLEVVCTSVDVTERKHAQHERERLRRQNEQAVRESETKFRDYAETASDWFWEIGPDYKFTLLTEKAFGSGAADRIGTTCWDHALDLETEPEKWQIVWQTLDARKPFRDFVYCTLARNGAPMYVKASGKPVFDANGEFHGYRGTGTDVTAAVRAQEELKRLLQLEADFAHMNRVSMLGELAASLSHEIMQPIASARNNARAAQNFLGMEPPDLGEVREAVTSFLGDTNRTGEIIDRIREQIKKAPLRKERFDLNAAINEVIILARSATNRNGVLVEMRLSDGLSLVAGDRVQLQQVLLNLILNAVEAMESVEAGPRELSIRTEQGRMGILVAVGDSGPGIEPGDRERVFKSFYTTKSGGTGMGLSICRSIIEAQGGRLWVEANEPRGAVFQFTLPTAENS